MRILLSGSTGFVGSRFSELAVARGATIVPLIRNEAGESRVRSNAVVWSPEKGIIDSSQLESLDAVVHLGGENIATRWTPARKQRLYDSRIRSTKLLADTLSKLSSPPSVFLAASAIGFYGNRGDEVLDEGSSSGAGFLAKLCADWENACELARQKGIRVVNARFGIVLDPAGGALRKMLPPFSLGLGGRLGTGRQYMSWITRDDAVESLLRCLHQSELEGPVNVVTPEPVTNQHFTVALGRAVHRPALFPVPAALLRLVFNEMADEALLASQRVTPRKLLADGFIFSHPELNGALTHLLRKAPRKQS